MDWLDSQPGQMMRIIELNRYDSLSKDAEYIRNNSEPYYQALGAEAQKHSYL